MGVFWPPPRHHLMSDKTENRKERKKENMPKFEDIQSSHVLLIGTCLSVCYKVQSIRQTYDLINFPFFVYYYQTLFFSLDGAVGFS